VNPIFQCYILFRESVLKNLARFFLNLLHKPCTNHTSFVKIFAHILPNVMKCRTLEKTKIIIKFTFNFCKNFARFFSIFLQEFWQHFWFNGAIFNISYIFWELWTPLHHHHPLSTPDMNQLHKPRFRRSRRLSIGSLDNKFVYKLRYLWNQPISNYQQACATK
jgi:hypothetical protein